MSRRHVLVARLDNAGDVLLAGPAVRAVAASGAEVTFLAGPAGTAAAELLPGVDRVVTWEAPWVPLDAPPVDRADVDRLVDRLAALALDEALVLTSFHQSPLPLALLLRMAGVPRLAATSVDHPGALLDERVPDDEARHEVEQALAVAASLGHLLPPGDDGALAVRPPPPAPIDLPAGYVVVHPAASVPSRGLPDALLAGVLDALPRRGRPVVVTGSAAERERAPLAPGPDVTDLRGRTDLAGLAGVLAGASAVVVGNTGPAHLAAAVGTPVVSVFAPVVAPHRWAPWRVPHRILGDLDVPCRGCRARVCPFEGQPCLAPVTAGAVVAAVSELVPAPGRPHAAVAS